MIHPVVSLSQLLHFVGSRAGHKVLVLCIKTLVYLCALRLTLLLIKLLLFPHRLLHLLQRKITPLQLYIDVPALGLLRPYVKLCIGVFEVGLLFDKIQVYRVLIRLCHSLRSFAVFLSSVLKSKIPCCLLRYIGTMLNDKLPQPA